MTRKAEDEGGCGVVGFCCMKAVPGRHIYEPSRQMHNRGNGKGGGIAAVGLVPEQLGVSRQVLDEHYMLHIALLVISLVTLPIIASEAWKPQGDEAPILRILLLLTVTIGLPYFLLSTTTPLLQAWYWQRFRTVVPYRLFALSNFASPRPPEAEALVVEVLEAAPLGSLRHPRQPHRNLLDDWLWPESRW